MSQASAGSVSTMAKLSSLAELLPFFGVGTRIRFDAENWVTLGDKKYRKGGIEVLKDGVKFIEGTELFQDGATFVQPIVADKNAVLRIIEWSSLIGCEYLRGRGLDNKLKVSPDSTLPLNEGETMKLANGEVHGGPYDAMGIGTYVEVSANDWVTVCGVTFRDGSFKVIDRGFEFDAATQFRSIPTVQNDEDLKQLRQKADKGSAEARPGDTIPVSADPGGVSMGRPTRTPPDVKRAVPKRVQATRFPSVQIRAGCLWAGRRGPLPM